MTGEDPRIPAALRSAPPPAKALDPLKYCVFTTVALLALVAGPFVVSVLGALGLLTYGRAVARGQRRTQCWLRDTRLVLVYLGAALAVGLAGVVRAVM